MNAPTGPGPGPDDQGEETINRVTGTHYENLMKKLLVVVRGMPKTWKQLTEVQQDNVLAEFDAYAKEALRNSVRDMAGADFPCIQATLDQVVVKDGIKAVLKMGQSSPHRHELVDSEGSTVLLILADASEYTKGERPKAEPAQADLGLGTAVDESMTDAERQQKIDDTKLAEEHAEVIKKQRDEAGAIAQLAEVGFDILPEEIANWSLEEITEARVCAVAMKNQKDGDEVTVPPILAGRFRKGRPTDIHDQDPDDL